MNIEAECLYRGFIHPAWLDLDTGEVIPVFTAKEPEASGYFLDVPDYVFRAPQRYIRMPNVDDVQVVLDFLSTELVPSGMSEQYRIIKPDYRNETYLKYTPGNELRGYDDPALSEFLSNFRCMLEEHPEMEDGFRRYMAPVCNRVIRAWAQGLGFNVMEEANGF